MSRFCVLVLLVGCRYGFGSIDDAQAAGSDALGDSIAVDSVLIDAADPSLVVYLRLDDNPAGGRFLDASGHHNDAFCIIGSTCPTTIGGKIGNGVHFDGTTQYATITHAAEMDTPLAFTIAAWLYVDDLSIDRVPIGRPVGSGSTDAIALVTWKTMTCMETALAGEVRQDTCSPFVMPLNQWHYIAGVWDGTFKSIWIDGVRASQIAGNTVVFDGHDIVVGADENSGTPIYLWQGRIDEFRYYSRALGATEIQALFNQ